MTGPIDWLARRYTKRGLARAVVALAVLVLASQGLFAWYFGSVGLSLREMAYDADDRTVVVDRADHRAFARHYDDDSEVGWCLYGRLNDTHVRIADVVNASAISSDGDHIRFTCARETAGQLATGQSSNLVGVVHSHPHRNRSRLSRVDTMTWGRTSPVVEVMGVYTERDGVEFFTVRSILDPLAKEVR